MASFADLKIRVQRLLKRGTFYDASGNDITDAATGQFVNFGLTTLQRYMPVKSALEVSATIVVGPTAGGGLSNHPFGLWLLPFPFRYGYDLWSSSAGQGMTPIKPLRRFDNIRDYHKEFPPTTLNIPTSPPLGPPRAYVIYNNQLTLGPFPDKNYTFVWDYVQILPQLVNPNDVNFYTLNADDALTYLACKEAAVWLQEDSLTQMFDGLAQQKIKDILRTLREEEVSEGDQIAQLLG